jgi:hypothetical protein
MKTETGDNPMNRLEAARSAPRCTARAKSTGLRCQAPAVRGWNVCRCHGARGGAPRGKRHGLYRHGLYTAEAILIRREVRALFTAARELLAQV